MSLGRKNATANDIQREARIGMNSDDAIKTQTRKLRPDGGHSGSVICNLTEDARQIVGMEQGEEVKVHVFKDFIAIERKNDEH